MNTEKFEKKPSLFIAMPCYDSVKINTMLSIFQLIQQLGKSGVEVGINTMKSPLIHQARNYLTSVFLTTDYTHLLFIDSDIEFQPEAVLHMLVAKKDIVCTPYRAKSSRCTFCTSASFCGSLVRRLSQGFSSGAFDTRGGEGCGEDASTSISSRGSPEVGVNFGRGALCALLLLCAFNVGFLIFVGMGAVSYSVFAVFAGSLLQAT